MKSFSLKSKWTMLVVVLLIVALFYFAYAGTHVKEGNSCKTGEKWCSSVKKCVSDIYKCETSG
jgi:hypothetical protein